MYGIYANIGGILMVNITIYIAYMDPMGLVPSCPVTWNTRRSVVTSSSRVVFPSVILAYVSSQIICVVAAKVTSMFCWNVWVNLYSTVLHINKKTINTVFNVFEQSPLSPTLGGERSRVIPFARPDQGIAVCC